MEAQKEELSFWVKYNLFKDGSPVADGFDEVEKAEKHIIDLKEKGYHPVRKYHPKSHADILR